jgi:GDPmannose 4,6-dehydratase
VQVSVRDFVLRAAAELGITLAFDGDGVNEVGTVAAVTGNRAMCQVGSVIVRIDQRYFRPTEVQTLLGDPGKAKRKLGWTPRTTLAELVSEMVASDYTSAQQDGLIRQAGFRTFDHHE